MSTYRWSYSVLFSERSWNSNDRRHGKVFTVWWVRMWLLYLWPNPDNGIPSYYIQLARDVMIVAVNNALWWLVFSLWHDELGWIIWGL